MLTFKQRRPSLSPTDIVWTLAIVWSQSMYLKTGLILEEETLSGMKGARDYLIVLGDPMIEALLLQFK